MNRQPVRPGTAGRRLRCPTVPALAILVLLLWYAVHGAPALAEGAEGARPEVGEPALQAGTAVRLVLVGGLEVTGNLLGPLPADLRLATREGERLVPIALVQEAWVGDHQLDPAGLAAAVQDWRIRYLPPDIPRPSPILVGTLSAAWPGLGAVPLQDRRTFWTYTGVELVFLGIGTLLVVEEQYAILLPLGVVDLLFRGFAAGESYREAKKRRRVHALWSTQPSADGHGPSTTGPP